VSEKWINKITSLVTTVETNNIYDLFGYGYMWWIYDTKNTNHPLYGTYSAQGKGGQRIYVIPKLDTVVVHMVFTDEFNENKKYKEVSAPQNRTILDLIISSYIC